MILLPQTKLERDSWVRKNPWRRKWQPLQHSCLRTPMDRGACGLQSRGRKGLNASEQLSTWKWKEADATVTCGSPGSSKEKPLQQGKLAYLS